MHSEQKSNKMKYFKGWILIPDGLSLPRGNGFLYDVWISQKVGDYTLFRHPETILTCGSSDNVHVHCVGIVCNVLALEKTSSAIVKELAGATAKGWSALYNAIEPLGGSFILFVEREGVHLILDATGTVPACHGRSSDGTIVGSHPRLVAECLGAKRSDIGEWWLKHESLGKGGRYMPGLLTAYEGIEVVIRNCSPPPV